MTVAAAVERSCAASRARERARTRRRARRRRPSARRCSGRSHQADFYRVCCVFLVGSFVFIAHSPHAFERPLSFSLPIVLPVSRVSSARSIGVVFFGARSSAAPGWFLLLLLLENEEQPEGSCCLIFVSSKRPLRKPKSNSHSEHPA